MRGVAGEPGGGRRERNEEERRGSDGWRGGGEEERWMDMRVRPCEEAEMVHRECLGFNSSAPPPPTPSAPIPTQPKNNMTGGRGVGDLMRIGENVLNTGPR